MSERDQLAFEHDRIACGEDSRDLSDYQEWRKTTDRCVQEALILYGTYLIGQTNGMSDALCLTSVCAMFEIEQIDPDSRPELTRRLLQIHWRVMEIHRMRDRQAKHG